MRGREDNTREDKRRDQLRWVQEWQEEERGKGEEWVKRRDESWTEEGRAGTRGEESRVE